MLCFPCIAGQCPIPDTSEIPANFVGIRRLKYPATQHSLFTFVNKKYGMKPRQRTLASFTAIIGLVTLILAVSVLAEKAHENHLPERNGRGTHEGLIAYGLSAGVLSLLSTVAGYGNYRHRSRSIPGTTAQTQISYCPRRDTVSGMEWPMRMPLMMMPANRT